MWFEQPVYRNFCWWLVHILAYHYHCSFEYLKIFWFNKIEINVTFNVLILLFEDINKIHRLDFEHWWFCESGYQIVSYFAVCHAWGRQKHNLSFNVHCSKTMRWIFLIIGMTNCHILGLNLPFTELNYLIFFV